jgi:hypothetical protein
LFDIEAKCCRAFPTNRVYEVSLREYADQFHPPIFHYQRADPMLSQPSDCKLDAVVGVYFNDVMALGP